MRETGREEGEEERGRGGEKRKREGRGMREEGEEERGRGVRRERGRGGG